ncbi:PASTA domain-containing protein [Desulfovibrio sp. OttesenSCG-928-G15]|nr:PASTA domain-containing protein [Desulfovibrio sp. OttesenSCG-928-G15]
MFGRKKSQENSRFGDRRGSSPAVSRRASERAAGNAPFRRRSAANKRTRQGGQGASSGFSVDYSGTSPANSTFSLSVDTGKFRLWSVAVVFTLLIGALWSRAYYLQIVKGPEYAAMAKRQHTAREQVTGVRGHIMDRNGNVLARSVECASIAINPRLIEDKQGSAIALSKAIKMPVSEVLAQLQDKKSFLWLARKVNYHTAESVRELGIRGVYIKNEYERVYPYKHLAGQLLGFVDIDDKGIEGLERAFNDDLSGRSVTRLMERDASGRRLFTPATASLVDLRGRNIQLTIDTQVQFFAEEALSENVEKYGAQWGGCIVVDVPTGDVLAWAQYPFFDPNNANSAKPADRRNRLATDMLEQGSTIKSFLIAAALEEGVVKPSTTINCEKGSWKLGKVTLHDTHAYANLSVDKILHVSSNIGVAKIGLKLGAQKYYEYLTRLGFGQRTGLPLAGEAKGMLRPASRWVDIDTATASFGQSFSATMAQMAQAYLCLASDGVKKPLRMLMDAAETELAGQAPAPADAGSKIFSPATMEKVRAMLGGVVEEEGGTGKQARIPGLVVGGKTGTAQKADKLTKRYGKGRVGSFVGMIPIEEPRYLIITLMDEPSKNQYGGVIATPVFRHVALNTMAYHGLLPDTDDPMVQEVVKREAERHAAKPGKADLGADSGQVRAKTGKTVAGKIPKAEPAPRPAQPGESVVPAVVGMGLRSAVEIFASEGIVPVVKGRGGFVSRQTPEPGRPWPAGAKECTLWLEERAS